MHQKTRVSPLTSCVILGKSLAVLEASFPSLSNKTSGLHNFYHPFPFLTHHHLWLFITGCDNFPLRDFLFVSSSPSLNPYSGAAVLAQLSLHLLSCPISPGKASDHHPIPTCSPFMGYPSKVIESHFGSAPPSPASLNAFASLRKGHNQEAWANPGPS